MCHNSSDDAVFIFDVFHAAADAVEGEHEGLCSPEAQKGAEQCEMEDEIADICEVFLFVVFLE